MNFNISMDTATESLESQVTDAPIVHLGPLEIFAMMFEHRDFKATTMFCLVYTQFLFVTGVISNMLNIIVLTRPSFRKLTTNIYFVAIAVLDTLNMLSLMEPMYLGHYWPTIAKVPNTIPIFCQLYVLSAYVLPQLSAWFLVAATFDRTIAVTFPHKVQLWITRRRTVLVIAIMIVVSITTNLPFGLNAFILDYGEATMCDVHWGKVHTFAVVHTITTYLLPSAVVLVGNVVIIYTVYTSSKTAGTLKGTKGDKLGNPQVLQMTYMLIGVSICSLVLTTPHGIFASLWVLTFSYNTLSKLLRWELTYRYLHVIYYTNSVVNFWIYAMKGKKFRDELRRLFGCCSNNAKRSMNSSAMSSTGATAMSTIQ